MDSPAVMLIGYWYNREPGPEWLGETGASETEKFMNFLRWGRLAVNTRIVTVLMLLICARGAFAQRVVEIPDAALKHAIRYELDIESDIIFDTDLLRLESLFAWSSESTIANLTGLEYAVNLRSLSLPDQSIASIKPIAELSKLRELRLNGNRIETAGDVSRMQSLSSIDLRGNRLRDVAGLHDLPQLKELELSDNEIRSLEGFGNLPTLITLSIVRNRLESLAGLETCPSLATLYAGENAIKSIDALRGLPNLREVDLHDNQIADILPLVENNLFERGDLRLWLNPLTATSLCEYLPVLRSRRIYIEFGYSSNLELICEAPEEDSDLDGLSNLQEVHASTDPNQPDTDEDGRSDGYEVSVGTSPRDPTDFPASPVLMPDEALRSRVILQLGMEDGEVLLDTDMARLEYLDAHGLGIEDLSGLETAFRLRILGLGQNNISDAGQLQSLKRLEAIDLTENKLAGVSGLSDLPLLRYLHLSQNEIVSLDGLTGLPSLEELDLSENNVTDGEPLAKLDVLIQLNLAENRIADLNFAANIPSLKYLNVTGNDLDSLEGIASMPGLIMLTANDNRVSDLSTMRDLPALEELHLENNKLSHAGTLNALGKLRIASLRRNQIQDLTGLRGAPSLLVLDLGENQATDLEPLEGMPKLEVLTVDRNQLSSVEALAEMPALRTVTASHNQIEMLTPLLHRTLESRLTVKLGFNPLTTVALCEELPVLKSHNVFIEVENGGDLPAACADPDGDLDGDGLRNVQEIALGTSMRSEDSDSDFISDGEEVIQGTDPLDGRDYPGTEIEVPDPALEAAVRDALNRPTGVLRDTDMNRITRLVASGKGIANLRGLEYCKHLEELYLSENEIHDLTPLRGLTRLWRLYLWDNVIVDTDPLSGLMQLRELEISRNPGVNLDGLASLFAIESLGLRQNGLVDAGRLAKLPKLTSLDLYENAIRDFTAFLDRPATERVLYIVAGRNNLSRDALCVEMPELRRRDIIINFESLYDTWPGVDGDEIGAATCSDPEGDLDADGLSNLFETNWGLPPENPDFDADGFSDAVEIEAGTNPSDPDDHPEPVDQEEINETALRHIAGELLFFFAAVDVNDDGLLSEQELQQDYSVQFAGQILRQLDINLDGYVSRAELHGIQIGGCYRPVVILDSFLLTIALFVLALFERLAVFPRQILEYLSGGSRDDEDS